MRTFLPLLVTLSVTCCFFINGEQSFGEENPNLFEGDMVVERGKDGSVRNAITDPKRKWPKVNGIVKIPYIVDPRIPPVINGSIYMASQDYAKSTCIRWVPRTNEKHFVVFTYGQGCFSSVGYSPTTSAFSHQDISLGAGCEKTGIALHEMMHTLGFWHEQARPDRDQFVQIQFQNIQSDMTNQFEVCVDCGTQNLPYDYGSIMHYGPMYFSKNGQPTVVAKKPVLKGVEIGQRLYLSQLDIQKIKKLYQC